MPIGGGGLLRLKKLLAISSGGAGSAGTSRNSFEIQVITFFEVFSQLTAENEQILHTYFYLKF